MGVAPRGRAALAGALAVTGALLAAVVQVQAIREQAYPPRTTADDSLYFSANAVRRLAGPMRALAADVYWIRALQHFGGAKRRLADRAPGETVGKVENVDQHDYALLYPLLDITTTLDPRFKIAYRFGAVFLAEPYPGGPGRPDLAVKLLQKGLEAQPDKWEYMEDIGFVYYWYRHDYRSAADWFARAADIPGAPWWLRSLSATTLAQGGDRNSSRRMWQSIRETAEIDWLRNDADRRLSQLEAMDVIDTLQQRVDEFTRREGHPPADWSDVARRGLLRAGVPLDPSGAPYELTPAGRVQLSPKSTLSPLPVDPPAEKPAA